MALVMLNIGLWRNDMSGKAKIEYPNASSLVDNMLLASGFESRDYNVVFDPLTNEPTYTAVVLDRLNDGSMRRRLYTLAESLHQDAIVLAYLPRVSNAELSGTLIGPETERYGKFDAALFIQPVGWDSLISVTASGPILRQVAGFAEGEHLIAWSGSVPVAGLYRGSRNAPAESSGDNEWTRYDGWRMP